MKEDNKDILIALIESILDIEIKELTYLNLEKNNGNLYVKRKHFDLHIKTETEKIEIEVNNHLNDYTRNRNASYIFDTYTYEVLRGEDYLGKTRVIQINLTYGLLSDTKYKDKERLRIYTLQDNLLKKYVENFYIYEINMDYLMKLWYSKNEKEIEIDKYKYLIMLDLDSDGLNNLSKKDRVVSKYMKEVERINENPEFHEFMSAEEDNRKIENSLRKEGFNEGIEKGIEQGAKEKSIETARLMKEEGIDSFFIKEITGIDVNK